MEGIHHCSAKHCKNDSETNSDLQFFPFPSETDRFQVWAALCNRTDLMNNSQSTFSDTFLCSEHFEDDQFEDDTRTSLSVSAVPTVFSSNSQECTFEDNISFTDEVLEFDPDFVKLEDSSNQSPPPIEVVYSEPGSNYRSILPKVNEVSTPPLRSHPTILRSSKKLLSAKNLSPAKNVLPSSSLKRVNISNSGNITRTYEKKAKPTENYIISGVDDAQDLANYLQAGKLISNEQGTFLVIQPDQTKSIPTVASPIVNTVHIDTSAIDLPQRVASQPTSGVPKQVSQPSTTRKSVNTPIISLQQPAASSAVFQNLTSSAGQSRNLSVLMPSNMKPTKVPNIAPKLPIPSKEERLSQSAFSSLRPDQVSQASLSSLKPKQWQDWPVTIETFLSAAKQLQANYIKMFPRRDRMDIETTLHLASHYNFLDKLSKAHCRARVHHFLKILELELEKSKKDNTTKKNKESNTKNAKDVQSDTTKETLKEQENDTSLDETSKAVDNITNPTRENEDSTDSD